MTQLIQIRNIIINLERVESVSLYSSKNKEGQRAVVIHMAVVTGTFGYEAENAGNWSQEYFEFYDDEADLLREYFANKADIYVLKPSENPDTVQANANAA